ncbi:MAG TPA: SigE family RNA polymerase sigma factor [Actinomycetes bacterium]|nr:SigE family RNA polymerase sigma factor [Actinomycetes bacterium]
MTDRYAGFAEFATARSPALMRTASLLTGDRGHAEDALQEALTKAAMKWPSIKDNPEPYVRQVLYRVVVDRWRWRSRRPSEATSDVPDAAVPTDVIADAERRLVLRDALARLTSRQRQVLVLRYYEDLTEVHTAQVMHCSVSTVKSQTRHALQRLRELSPELADAFGAMPADQDRPASQKEVRA